MTLQDLQTLGVPAVPPGHFYRVTVGMLDAKGREFVRVEVRRDSGPSWWPQQRSFCVADGRAYLSDWSSGGGAIAHAARRCFRLRGSGRKRVWVLRHEATQYAGDHR